MKYKSYEDSAEQNTTGLNLELIGADDVISARTTNRPIVNLYENQETNYNLIQTLLKTIYGNVNGIIPDVLESFAPEDFAVGSFKNDTGKYFLRIPTGMALFRSDLDNSKITKTDGNPFSKKGEYNYKDQIHKSNFMQDDLRTYAIESKPELNLYERELAKLIDLDLTDSTNDIKIYCDINKFTYKIAVLDNQTGLQKLDSSGSPVFVTDSNSNVLYKSKPNQGEYEITGVKSEAITTISYTNVENKETPSNISYYAVTDGNYKITKSSKGNYTSDLNKAEIAMDVNDNYKYKTGYYMKVVRATTADDEITYLPNRKENASWKICLPKLTVGKNTNYTYSIIIKDGNGKEVEKFDFVVIGSNSSDTEVSIEDINTKLYSSIISLSSKFVAERFSENVNSNIISGVKILASSDNQICNDYKITIKRTNTSGTTEIIKDYITKENISEILATPKTEQKYYDNIFELTNAFLGYYSSYLIKIESLYDYINLETIFSIPNANLSYFVFYDLNANKDNGINASYDKSGKFFISTDEKQSSNFIKMFKVTLGQTPIKPNTVSITNIVSYLPTIDRRFISTKRAELNSLDVNARTELTNYLHVKDLRYNNTKGYYSNREIEMTEYSQDEKDDQLRITSPVMRIVDKKDDETGASISELPDKWTDSGKGDTESDFYETPTAVRDFDTNKTKYLKHNDSNNKGIIIDKNKGISIFNNDIENTDGLYSYSSLKPIEIVSKASNINIFRKGNNANDNGRINIANFKDTANNIVDIKGVTRIRSKNDGQLVVRKIGDFNKPDNKANISFVVGTTNSKDNTKANDNTKDLFVGSLNFYSGDSTKSTSVIAGNNDEKNRFFSVKISDMNDNTPENVFVARNAKSLNSKKILTMYGDIVPYNNQSNFTIGFPYGSRTYNKSLTPIVPYYEAELESTLKVDKSGNSTEFINNEGRWLAAFFKRGYFGHLTVADNIDDLINDDSRNGNLRLNNSNIYDTSSIYINYDNTSGSKTRANVGTINFDNEYAYKKSASETVLTENTIYSKYDSSNNRGGISLVLYRGLGTVPSTDTNDEKEFNAAAAYFNPYGTEIRKNLYVRRQEFINTSSSATTEDNSSLVVKGQSVLNGEVVIGKSGTNLSKDKISTVDKKAVGAMTANKEDSYKKYNWEYYGVGFTGSDWSDKSFKSNTPQSVKDRILFISRIYGRSYFNGDITLDENSKFTENTTFNKAVKISNNNYANFAYNEVNNSLCPKNDERYVSSVTFDRYYNSSAALPRHHTSFDIVSGKVVFGSGYNSTSGINDKTDFELYGSQFIRRRLEIGTSSPSLFDTFETDATQRLIYDGLYVNAGEAAEYTSSQSAKLYVDGGTQFNGDVVFGYNLKDKNYEDSNKINSIIKCLRNHKPTGSDKTDVYGNPSKVIFWGNNASEISTDDEKNPKYDWKSDFDFHGKTKFDNSVRIGTPTDDISRPDTNEADGKEEGSLEIFGKNTDALKVEGNALFGSSDSENTFVVDDKYISLSGNCGGERETYADIALNSKTNSGKLITHSSDETAIYGYAEDSSYKNYIKLNESGAETKSTEKVKSLVEKTYVEITSDAVTLKHGNTDETKNTEMILQDNYVKINNKHNTISLNNKEAKIEGYCASVTLDDENLELTICNDSKNHSTLTMNSSGASLSNEEAKLTLNDATSVKLQKSSTMYEEITDSRIYLKTANTSAELKDTEGITLSSTNDDETYTSSLKIAANASSIGSSSASLGISSNTVLLKSIVDKATNSINLDTSGNITITSGTHNDSITLKEGDITISSNSGRGTITLKGAATLNGNVTLNGALSTSGNITVNQKTTIYSNGKISASGDISSDGSLSAKGNISCDNGKLSAASGSITNNMSCGSLTVGGYTFALA